jgi:4-hydroxybenzoate polyprenyltransferase
MAASASSSTSSRTSASSSTSDPARTVAARSLGWIRLTHPFPSVLDGLVSGAIAAIAGASPDLAVRIGLAMTLLQLGIGTVNDIVDAPRDAGRKAGKPIPAGLVSPQVAWALAIVVFVVGTTLSAGVSAVTGLLALVVIAIGLAYDLRLKGTAWSWLPFAVGIPILAVFGWVGATGTLDPIFAILVPSAVVAGGALAIGNAVVDVERDREAGVSSVVVAFGLGRATRLAAALFAAVWAVAWVSAAWLRVDWPIVAAIGILGLVPVAAAAWAGRATSERRERLWQVEAIGLALLAGVWLVAVLSSSRAAS